MAGVVMQPRDHRTKDEEDSGELQFINLSSNYNGDPNTKKVVRKHVMAKFRRDQRKEQSSASKPKTPKEASGNKPKLPKPKKPSMVTAISPSSPVAHIPLVDKSPLSDCQPKQTPTWQNWPTPETDIQDEPPPQEDDEPEDEVQLIRLPEKVGAVRADPFNALPIDSCPHSAYLLDHCE